MILIEILIVGAVIAMLFGMLPQLQAWLKGVSGVEAAAGTTGPSRLMARIVQPEPFPSTVSPAVAVTVMVMTVGNGTFTPEAGATVSFSVGRGNACVNGVTTVTQATDALGIASVQVMSVRTGREELIVTVVARGNAMPVSGPIQFDTLA